MEGIADYTFVEALGDATHGLLFLAARPSRLPGSDALVVVKVLTGANDDALRRFTRELRAFAAVQSPYLVALLDAGQQDDRFFYAREHLEGGTLRTPTRPLSRGDALRAVAHAALAAHALHEAGLAHRDIRPSNIWLHDEGAKLGDLSLAQSSGGGEAVTTMVPRSSEVMYLDPACIFGESASRASDVYSLGATLHFALSGRPVYKDLPEGDAVAAVRTIMRAKPELAEDLRDGEAALIRACLAPDSTDRPATAAEVADRLLALGSS